VVVEKEAIPRLINVQETQGGSGWCVWLLGSHRGAVL